MDEWNHTQLKARDGPLLLFTALYCFTGTVHTIAASLHEIPLVTDSLLHSLLESLLGSMDERAELWEE
jgi:hypothetical protein